MALFRRSKKQDNVLPEEVSQYYQSQRRERTGMAILMGVTALIVTLLIGAGLFFGGRYIYREYIADDNNTSQNPDQVNDSDNQENKDSENNSGNGTQNDAQNQDNTSNGTNTPGSGNADEQTNPTPTPSPAAPTPSPATPSTGDNALPHTGDPGM